MPLSESSVVEDYMQEKNEVVAHREAFQALQADLRSCSLNQELAELHAHVQLYQTGEISVEGLRERIETANSQAQNRLGARRGFAFDSLSDALRPREQTAVNNATRLHKMAGERTKTEPSKSYQFDTEQLLRESAINYRNKCVMLIEKLVPLYEELYELPAAKDEVKRRLDHV